MKGIDELNNILLTLKKYDLPVSPILEYSIQEKIESLSVSMSSEDESPQSEDNRTDLEDNLSQPSDKVVILENEESSSANCEKVIPYLRRLAINILDAYPDSKKWIIIKKFLYGENMSQLASEYNLSHERIRQIIQHNIGELSDFEVNSCETVTNLRDENSTLRATIEKQDQKIKSLEGRPNPVLPSATQNIPTEAYTALISEIKMPVRLKNVLLSNNIETVYELSELSIPEFFKMRNAGRRSLLDAKELLSRYGLNFKETEY